MLQGVAPLAFGEFEVEGRAIPRHCRHMADTHSRTTSCYLHGLATAVPPYELDQSVVEARAAKILGPRFPAFQRMRKTFGTAGVEMRYSAAPLEWFEGDTDWADRNTRYLEAATALFIETAQGALQDAGWQGADIDIVVTVSSTGIATPTLEARAKAEVGLRDDVLRVPVFGLGCAGGVSGMSIARELSVAHPGARVLLVVVETCSLSFQSDTPRKADIIATVLFGDGAAAACLSTDPSSIEVGRGHTKTWPDTLPIMGWDVGNSGLGVVFDRSIPDFTTAEFRGALDAALDASGLSLTDLDRLVCHPGGAKVVDAIEASCELPPGTLDHERETLRHYGNMSAPTVLFVLKRALDAGQTGQLLTCALGPGFSAAFQPVRVSA